MPEPEISWEARVADKGALALQEKIHGFLETPVSGKYQAALRTKHGEYTDPAYAEKCALDLKRECLTKTAKLRSFNDPAVARSSEALDAVEAHNYNYFRIPEGAHLQPVGEVESYDTVFNLARYACNGLVQRANNYNSIMQPVVALFRKSMPHPKIRALVDQMQTGEDNARDDYMVAAKYLSILQKAIHTLASPQSCGAIERDAAMKHVISGDVMLEHIIERFNRGIQNTIDNHIIWLTMAVFTQEDSRKAESVMVEFNKIMNQTQMPEATVEENKEALYFASTGLVKKYALAPAEIIMQKKQETAYLIALRETLKDMNVAISPIAHELREKSAEKVV